MEPDRVEMSVGGGLVNGDHVANGIAVNGTAGLPKKMAQPSPIENGCVAPYTNGATLDDGHMAHGPRPELQMISTEFYLPMAKLIGRSAQTCWNDMLDLVERWAKITIPAQSGPVGMPGMPANDQTKANLDKKDAFLNFANHHKATFVKLLVLLQWSKRGEDVRKTIELNFWLVQRRTAYMNATFMLGQMLQDLASAQVPNPDLITAAEVLATGKVSDLPDLGYIQPPPMSPRQILRTLKRLNSILCSRMILDTDIPSTLTEYHVHDGRITFRVPSEFELDLSVMDETLQSKLLMVDVRFLFSPAPSIPDSLHDEISYITNSAIEKNGLVGAYDFIHDLCLSYKLSELYRQARELARGLWAGHLKVEMIRRTLVVQYWPRHPGPRSWLEIGIHSGRSSSSHRSYSASVPQLRLRWFRCAKLVDKHGIVMNEAQLSVEEILRQVIAQHVNSLFDSIYDQLLLSPLYADGELELDQSSSLNDPGQCSLELQLSKSERLFTRIEPVAGSITLGPVSDKTNRVQSDLARSKNLPDDFVSRISSLRCSIAEANLLRTMSSSGWQRLDGVKLTHAEIENLFGRAINRATFFKQQHWSPAWMLAMTTSITGDHWWLMQRVRDARITGSYMTEILKSRPLHLQGALSPAYMESLADYTSGVIVLQSNAQHLTQAGYYRKLLDFPEFSNNARLPSLWFSSSPNSSVGIDALGAIGTKSKSRSRTLVELSYHGADQVSKRVVTIARAPLNADTAVLTELASSKLDASIVILPESRQVMIKLTSEAGSVVIEDVVSKLTHLNDIVACAAIVKKSSNHTLQSLSLSQITIIYNSDVSRELKLVITFADASRDTKIDLLPHDHNPHQYATTHLVELLNKNQQNLSQNLEEVLALLRMTQPLASYLHKLQTDLQTARTETQNSSAVFDSGLIRVHVLTRQAATYAIHYFSTSEEFARDTSDSETPKKLLVRLEILPMKHGLRNMWIVRPAIEEFASYIRPSYTSNALQSKLKTDIFSRNSTPNWIPLDDGAACSVERPEKLLSTVHDSTLQWLEQALKLDGKALETAEDSKGKIKPKVLKEALQPQTKQNPPVLQRPSVARPNGVQHQTPQANQSYNNSKNKTVKREVITLD